MFTILTQPLSWRERLVYWLKRHIKYILGKNTYWPNSVIQSIIWWLAHIQNGGVVWYNIDPKEDDIYSIVFVPNGIETLKYALRLKKQWIIQSLIAWPNISIPENKNDICFHPNIDTILVPSEWVKDYFLSINPQETRIQVWAAGVDDMSRSLKNKPNILVYKKNCPKELFEHIINFLTTKKIPYTPIGYGDFKKEDYIRNLKLSSAMVYLQESESQWLALHESWMADIPTLVWNRWFWEYGATQWYNEKISAPYMTVECGLFFQWPEDFNVKFTEFMLQLEKYSPRTYSLENFTNEITTRKLLQIIQGTWTK